MVNEYLRNAEPMTVSQDYGTLASFSNSLADLIDQAGQGIVGINGQRRRSTSGVHWRSQIIVTTDEGIKGDGDITVTLANGQAVAATLVGRDAGTDLAVLRLSDTEHTEQSPLPVATIGDSTALKVGHLVVAIARDGDSNLSASMGVISALGGGWRTWQGGRIDQFIRPSLNLYHGFSGGALVDTTGRVVGINTTGPRHMTLTIPATTVNRVVDQLLQGGRIVRGYLGLGLQAVQLPETLQRSLSLTQAHGVMVVSVEPGAPGDQAGVLLGDILVSLAGSPVQEVRDIHAALDPDRIGQAIVAVLIRGGERIERSITVGERPTQEG